MALTTGLSYRDWVRFINDTQLYGTKEFNLTLTQGVEIIDIKNMATPRLKQVGRASGVPMTTSIGTPPFANGVGISLKLARTNTGKPNIYDGEQAMTIGLIQINGHNKAYTAGGDKNSLYVEVTLKGSIGQTIHSSGHSFLSQNYQDNKMTILLDAVYTDVYTAELNIIQKSSSASDFDIGRLWIGNYLESCFDSDYNLTFGDGINTRKSMQFQSSMIDESSVTGGNPSWIDFSKTASAGKELLSINNDSYPNGNDVVIVPRIDTATALRDLSIYGIITKPIKLSHVAGQFWDASIDIKQLI